MELLYFITQNDKIVNSSMLSRQAGVKTEFEGKVYIIGGSLWG